MALVAVASLLATTYAAAQSDHGFTFVRIKYGSESEGWGRRFGGETWAHDYPTAEYNFYEALERTTKIHVNRPPVVLELSDPRIFEYPVLYLCEPGYWEMTDEEVKNLREYLDRGGFMFFDDFRGEAEFVQFAMQVEKLYPDKSLVELPNDHAIWSIYYDVDPVAAPSLVSGLRGRRFGGGGGGAGGGSNLEDRYFGLFDNEGRMMMMICFNQDLGDGWEYPDFEYQDASLITFQMGVNFLIYALTH